MPQLHGSDTGERRRGGRRTAGRDGVQVSSGITSPDHLAGADVRDREAKFIKLDRDRILTRKLPNRQQIGDKRGRKQNIAKNKWRIGGDERPVAGVGDRETIAVADHDLIGEE